MAHAPDQFLLQLLVIFASAKVVGELFERLKLPSVLGEILAGAALGPYALAWIVPSDTIHSVAEIGAIFVLFSAGLETSPQDLIQVGRKALLVAVAEIVVPFALGFAYMKWRGDGSSEAIFVGAAMVATSVGITARVLADLRVLATRTAKVILGAAVFDDILGMVLLAIVAGLASSGGLEWLHLGVLMVEAAAFSLFMIFIAPRIVRRIQPGVDRLYPTCSPHCRFGALPVSFLAVGQNWHGGHHWRVLCRTHVCRLRSAMESSAASRRHYRIPGAFLLFLHRLAFGRASVYRRRFFCRDCDFSVGDRVQGSWLWAAVMARGLA